MRRWFEIRGQALCYWLAVMRVDHGQPWGWLEKAWTGIWWRYYCPRPVIGDWTARACIECGHCGCDNLGSLQDHAEEITLRIPQHH